MGGLAGVGVFIIFIVGIRLLFTLFDESGDFLAIVFDLGDFSLRGVAAFGGAGDGSLLDFKTMKKNLRSLQRDGGGVQVVAELTYFGEKRLESLRIGGGRLRGSERRVRVELQLEECRREA